LPWAVTMVFEKVMHLIQHYIIGEV
jgi:hypothetical protein